MRGGYSIWAMSTNRGITFTPISVCFVVLFRCCYSFCCCFSLSLSDYLIQFLNSLCSFRPQQNELRGTLGDGADTVRIVSLLIRLCRYSPIHKIHKIVLQYLTPSAQCAGVRLVVDSPIHSRVVSDTLLYDDSAVSLDQDDVDTNKELVGHGYSNLFAGFTGSVLVSSL